MKCHEFAHERKVNHLGIFNQTSEGLTKKWNLIFCEGLSNVVYNEQIIKQKFSDYTKWNYCY